MELLGNSSFLIEQLMNAIMLGCIYTLVAVGFSLFFGVLDVVVFCSGDIAVFGTFSLMGAYMIFETAGLTSMLPMPVWMMLLMGVAAILCAGLGVFTYLSSIRPFEKSSSLMPLLSTIALGVVIREAIGLFFPLGRNPQRFPRLIPNGSFGGHALLSYRNVTIICVTFLVLLAVFFFLRKSKMGNAMQAMAQNKRLAAISGINIRSVAITTFVLGGLLLSVAGFLIGAYYGTVRFDNGSLYGIKGFSAAVVGGLSNVYGAIIGGMLLAFIEVFVSILPGGAAYASAVAFIVVVIFMVAKPEGILGEKTVEKV